MENNNSISNKILPQSIEAESHLLASLIIDPNSFEKLLDQSSKLKADDFYDKKHFFLFQIIEKLVTRNIPVDLITLNDELTAMNLMEKVGGIGYISGLLDRIPTSANIEYYANIIKNKSMLRNLINICTETISKSLDTPGEIDKLIDETEKKIFDINEEKHSSSISTIKDNLYEIIEEVHKKKNTTGDLSGIPSGFYNLDEITDGFHGSELVVIAARPSIGKTAFALNMISKSGVKHNKKIGLFSCEMGKKSLVIRMLSSGASVDQLRMRKNILTQEEQSRLINEAERLYDSTIVFDDTPNVPILELRSKARRMVKDYDVEIIYIDYLQLITVEESMRRSPRHEQIAYVSRSLKALSRQLDVPIIALAQLNREIESRGDDSRPRLSDLKDSGSIEQDADLILFIHKPKSGDTFNNNDMTEPREIVIGKNRNGPTGIINMIFQKNFTRFELLKKENIQ